MTRILILIAVCAYALPVFSQVRSCGMESHMETLMQDEAYAKEHKEKLAFFRAPEQALIRTTACANPTVLPVAVHFQGLANPNAACLFDLAENQIQTLNDDFQGINADISNWNNNASSSFNTTNGESCIIFCLATTSHPAGHGLVEGDYAVTINQFTGDTRAAFSGYINIFVRNVGALGYSPLGGTGNGDGVTIDNNAFGTVGNGCTGANPSSPYNRGRTLTHEMGHYLLLDHIWGGGCGIDDGIGDTPSQQTSYGGCPAIGSASCGSTDMHMNYMDYTNDACMYMWSAGQMAVMDNYAISGGAMANVRNNAASTCAPPNTCPVFLNLTANVTTGTQTTQVQNYITSTSNLTGTSDVTYEAGIYIDLLPGFTQSNNNFLAHIIGCTPLISDDNQNFVEFQPDALDVNAVLTEKSIAIDIQTIEDAPIEIEVFDRLGNQVLHLKDSKIVKAGKFHVDFDGEFSPGMYFVKVKSRTNEVSKKVILLE